MEQPPEERAPEERPDGPAALQESRGERLRRRAQHLRLFSWTAIAVAVVVCLVVLVVQNTRHVRVGWIFGHSHISLVYLVLFATLLGWLLGLATTVLFLRRARRRP